jgi:hypothetical protein
MFGLQPRVGLHGIDHILLRIKRETDMSDAPRSVKQALVVNTRG